ncbi:hypothetical protein [Methanosarcina vacuolata]|uniref:hypothetical protein n=1 Tax=Methanosarcina vacuolata TaxID=2215 RepID=UPI000A745567|nr:hypothetical protein [Methanosarcina vacuolata]
MFCPKIISSPKLHFHLVWVFKLVSINTTVAGVFPEVGDAEDAATGFAISYFMYYDIHK